MRYEKKAPITKSSLSRAQATELRFTVGLILGVRLMITRGVTFESGLQMLRVGVLLRLWHRSSKSERVRRERKRDLARNA